MADDPLKQILTKCEQYWNERNVCDEEYHAALAFIHARANEIIAAHPAPEPVRAWPECLDSVNASQGYAVVRHQTGVALWKRTPTGWELVK